MAEHEQSAEAGSESDLRARIQARVAERRATQAAEQRRVDAPAASEPAGADSAPATGADSAPSEVTGSTPSEVTGSTPTEPMGARQPPDGSAAVRTARASRAPTGRRAALVNRLTSVLAFLLAVTVTVVVLRSFVVSSYYIPSASMEPTLHGCQRCEPDLVLVDKLSYRFGSVARSDVVVFDRPPLAPPEASELIKRVIGLPGETISGRGGKVFVGDKALVEPYVHPDCGGTADFAAVRVPAGEYFVMGDNRCASLDSRIFGVIPGSSIVGRAVAVSWPLKHLRWL